MEYVQAKEYRRFEKKKIDWGSRTERTARTKTGKETPGKTKPTDTGKTKPGTEKPAGATGKPQGEHPLGKQPLAIERKPPVRPHGGPIPGEIGGGARRPALGAGRPAGPRPHDGPGYTPIAPGRQFGERALPPAPNHGPLNEADRRRQDLANLVAEVQASRGRKALPGGEPIGEIVEPGNAYQRHAGGHTDRSIWDAEVVGHNDGKSTGRIRAIQAASHDRATEGVPVQKARAGDTSRLDTVTKTTELPRTSARQFAMSPPPQVTSRADSPNRIALTQHAEPFGQMSLFHVPGAETLTNAQQGRTERRSTVPPSMPRGRQGVLFHPVSFKI